MFIVTKNDRNQINRSPLTPNDISIFEDEDVDGGYAELARFGCNFMERSHGEIERTYAPFSVVYYGDSEEEAQNVFNQLQDELVD